MGTKNLNSATDLITFTRASGGTALRKISYGSELVTNGDFDGNIDGWTGGSYDAVTGDLSLISSGFVDAYQIGFDPTKKYLLTYTVSEYTSGNISAYDGTKFGSYTNAVGTYSIIISPDVQRLGVRGQNGPVDAKISNISVKEVLYDQPDGTLQLFNHPDNVPRIEYDADGTVKGLLIEEQRTNDIRDSSNLTSSTWIKGVSVTSTTDSTAPDSTNTAYYISNVDGYRDLLKENTVPLNERVMSVYAKAGEYHWLYMLSTNSSGYWASQSFDLLNGEVGTSYRIGTPSNLTDAKIEPVGDGWYRCSVKGDATNTSSIAFMVGDTDSIPWSTTFGTAGGLYLCAAQVEAGAFPTSYIPTSGATATRAADIASIPVADFGYNSDAGSVLVEAQRFGTNNYPRSVMIDAGNTHVKGIGLGAWGTNTSLTGYIVANGSVQAAMDTGNAGTSAFKNSLAYKENDFAASRDGNTVITDTSAVVPTGLTTLRLGRNAVEAQFLNGHIKSIKYYPRRLSNTQLQELTT